MSNGVTFYADINYQGKSWTYDTDIEFVGEANDAFSSVRIPAGMTVVLYQHDKYNGQQLTLTSDTPDLRAFPGPGPGNTWNDAASSVKFTGGSSGGGSGGVERLKRGDQYAECGLSGSIVFVANKSDFGKVKITAHNDKHFDATFDKTKKVLSIQPDGRLESREEGMYGGYEMLDAITAPSPNEVSLLYRVDSGGICGGMVLQIVKE